MRDMLIGPGQPCESCHKDYGLHTTWCARAKARREMDQRRGRALIEAIQSDDALLVGKILRGEV
jgi:hypothetical protein